MLHLPPNIAARSMSCLAAPPQPPSITTTVLALPRSFSYSYNERGVYVWDIHHIMNPILFFFRLLFLSCIRQDQCHSPAPTSAGRFSRSRADDAEHQDLQVEGRGQRIAIHTSVACKMCACAQKRKSILRCVTRLSSSPALPVHWKVRQSGLPAKSTPGSCKVP